MKKFVLVIVMLIVFCNICNANIFEPQQVSNQEGEFFAWCVVGMATYSLITMPLCTVSLIPIATIAIGLGMIKQSSDDRKYFKEQNQQK